VPAQHRPQDDGGNECNNDYEPKHQHIILHKRGTGERVVVARSPIVRAIKPGWESGVA
jgi:hypothetical protein